MKPLLLLSVASLICATNSMSQDKKAMKQLEKQYGAFTNHKKVFQQDEWATCKFSLVYKLTTAMTATSVDKKDYGGGKVKAKTSSGAYAVLSGVNESDLQAITEKVGERFAQRLKDEASIALKTWSAFSDAKHTAKLKEMEEDRESYSRSQGVSLAFSVDGAPHYNRVITLIPGGKKLSKEIEAAVSEITLIFDFAEMLATAEAKVKYGGSSAYSVTYNISETTDQQIIPGIRLTPKIGSQAATEAATDIQGTQVKVQDELGYMFYVGLPQDIVSRANYVESIEESDGAIPAVLQNRRNNRMESTTTWTVHTTPAAYEKAVLDAVDQYLDVIIQILKYHQ